MTRYILLAAALALAALSCDEPTGPPPFETPYPEPTSPKLVLNNVQMSFNRLDINRVKAMLARDFVFYFDPDDVGQCPPGKNYEIPESWTYTDFWVAVRNMLEQAYSISLDINAGDIGAPGEGANTYKAENVKISLLVMIDEDNGFRAGELGYCNFEFERYDGEGGQKLWRLTGWWDRTAKPATDASAGGTPTSLGTILSLYR